jgi:hypothetical protein
MKQVLSVHALVVFTIFCFLVDEITKFQVLASPLKLLLNFENPCCIFQNPKAGNWTLKMPKGNACESVKNMPEAAGDMLIFAHFPCSQ